MDAATFFKNRKMLICSMHGKEKVMKAFIAQDLKLETDIIKGFNTDAFGTFAGEVERILDPVTTLRLKIREGLKHSGATLGIGNEGSFGPHPQIPFVPADQEIVMVID